MTASPRRTEAVLFDFDGVIADTENVHVAAWQRTLARSGYELSDAAAARSAEVDDRAFLVELFARRKVEGADVEGWIRLKEGLAEALLADAPRIYPGVVALVRGLRSDGIRLGIVTTTRRRNVEIVLASAGQADAFEVIIAKEDVSAFKPAPEGYKAALDKLGIPASRAIAVEDSPSGLESARAAGLRVVAVGHRRPAGDWTGDAAYVADLADPGSVLAALGLA